MRKIIFRLKLALGDALVFTAGVRDFKLLFPDILIDVDSNFREFFKNNPYITQLDKNDPEVEKYTISNSNVNNSNGTWNHYIFGFLFDMISQAGFHKSLDFSAADLTAALSNGRVGDKDAQETTYKEIRKRFKRLGEEGAFKLKPDLHLTNEDKIKVLNGVEKYWVIAPGGKSDATTKIWDWREFQKVIDYFDGKIKFVTIGKSNHILTKLNNIIDLTDKTPNPRDLIPLVYHADGCVSGISFLMHFAAALEKPCVSIYAGREPVSYTCYNDHMILHTQSVLDCCDNGSGCWTSKVVKTNNTDRVCKYPVEVNGQIVPKCMTLITPDDIIRNIEKYYEGNKLQFNETKKEEVVENKITITRNNSKIINILASLRTHGGGEKSIIEIARILSSKYEINFVHIRNVDDEYKEFFEKNPNIKLSDKLIDGVPLLFYANDDIDWFCDNPQMYTNVSDIMIGINYITSKLKNCKHLANDSRLKAIFFQNIDKLEEFRIQQFGFNENLLKLSIGAVNLNPFIQIPTTKRNTDEKLIILKTGVPDWRKYITSQSENKGEKKLPFQKHIILENDMKFYDRLDNDMKGKLEFRFMQAHIEIEEYFKNRSNFKFYKFDQIDIKKFLSEGHLFLHRTSLLWSDNYPRSIAEALASGLPVICEPRDGPRDRVIHGRNGLYAIDYDSFLWGVKLLHRKEILRQEMSKFAKIHARDNFDSKIWLKLITESLGD